MRRLWDPEVIQATPASALGALRSATSSGDGQPVLTIPTNRGGCAALLGDAADLWCVWSAGMTPVTGQFSLSRGHRTLV